MSATTSRYRKVAWGFARRAGVDVKRNVGVNGLFVDAVAKLPDGKLAVFEMKRGSPPNYRKAIEQVRRYAAALRTPKTYFVYEDVKQSHPELGIVATKELPELVSTIASRSRPTRPSGRARTARKRAASRTRKTDNIQKELIFAAMPFSSAYDDTYLVAMRGAAKAVGAACERVDHGKYTGDVVDYIRRQIRKSIAVFADLSESRPNVLYEVGYAEARGRPVVQLCSTPLEKLPFDVRNNKTLEYSKGRTTRLKSKLTRELRTVLQKNGRRSKG